MVGICMCIYIVIYCIFMYLDINEYIYMHDYVCYLRGHRTKGSRGEQAGL